MTDHIVVFDGNQRLIGQTVQVHIDEATAFTLFGTVVTGEQVGVDGEERGFEDRCESPGTGSGTIRLSLPLV